MPAKSDARAENYKKFLKHAAENCSDLQELRNFVFTPFVPLLDCTAKTSLVEIGDQESPSQYKIRISYIQGPDHLLQVLDAQSTKPSTCRLFIVENADPETIARLGGVFELDPQLFADYLEDAPWHRIASISKHLPPLRSIKARQSFIRLRFIEPMEMESGRDTDSIHSFMYAEEKGGWVRRKAGKLKPRSRTGERFNDVLFTRHSVMVWFSARASGTGWDGIILLQPPFVPEKNKGTCGHSEYRTFCARPDSPLDPGKKFDRSSMRDSLVFCLKHRPEIIQDSINDPFIVLQDLFRIVASEWTVVLTYLERELVTIEYCLEKEDPTLEELETYLKDLFVHRRRVTRYCLFILEARDACASQGQKSWPRSARDGPALEVSTGLVADFDQLEDLLARLSERITKNINLLTALVSIGEGKLGRAKNQNIAMLTKVGVLFIPFSTIATVLGMEGPFAPGQPKSWIFWVASVLGILLIVALSYLYEYVLRRSFTSYLSQDENNT
ncbi:hypothetical protein H2201_006843 [Coniosporium apollinis]|uniref:Uncharacterized protein n=1 Tax=Coniosporium apollinis TaxID=61459 RepID=A0ABQ9NNZ4_9PEZI|nr:hypothetical protein H2201_006843 [Coniosporium apollinis]